MSQIDTVRPASTLTSGDWTAVPSGTLHGVTSDNSDSTYALETIGADGRVMELNTSTHNVPANHERHAIRIRVRGQSSGATTVAGSGTWAQRIGTGGSWTLTGQFSASLTSTLTTYTSSWVNANTLIASAANVFGVGYTESPGQVNDPRVMELYVDIDNRAKPDFPADVLDAAGVSRDGGTVSDTNRPTLVFGSVAYDGLPALDWSVTVGGQTFSGSGTPPTSVQTAALVNGSYDAVFTVRSTIRGADPFSAEQSVSFTVDFDIPPPPPPANLTATEVDGAIRLCWENPGGQPWDDDFVIAEVLRSDCGGEYVRIAVIEDALTACYTDYAVPTRNADPGCDTSECAVAYQVRYWGTVSTTIQQPSNVPSGFIVGWPSTVGTIPSGWTRVTALDDLFPRGSAAAVSGATGGTATHSHTTPGHDHHINSHTHSVGGSTGTSNSSTTSARFNGASQAQADQPHSHTRTANTGSGGAAESGSTAPATDSADNLPAYRRVIWVQSDGSPTAFTAGMLAFSAEDVTDWADDAASSGRYLRGAAAGGNGGATGGSNTHSHTVASHSHTGVTHGHSIASTGLSNPLSTIEAGDGSSQPEWLPRHTHPMTVGSSASGSTNASDGGPTDSVSLEPPNRRLRVLANTGGGLSTRMIGLFRGNSAALPATMVRCDGSNGTPDMRDWFARERGSDSLGTTGGTTTHTHTTGNHSHTMPSHTHTTSVGVSQTNSFERPSFGDLGDSPTTSHTHTSGGTGSTTPTTQTSTSGTTGSTNHVPQYEDVHFVRLEGVSVVTGIAVPQILESEVAEITVDAPLAMSDRLATDSDLLNICPTSSYDLPRLQQRATPLAGGLPQVSTTTHGLQRQLDFPVRDADVPAVEALLAEAFIWYAPLTEPAAWYACGGWSVRPQTPGLKTVQVTLVRADPPALEDPENLL